VPLGFRHAPWGRLDGVVHGIHRAVGRVDATVGDAVESTMRMHHRRRLRRIGWKSALDAPPGFAAPRGFAMRPDNAIEVLIDGAAALPRIAAAINASQQHVHLAGWYFSPEFALVRGAERVVLSELLRATAARGVDVRVLAWAGAPLPVFRPSRRTVAEAMRRLAAGSRVRVATDHRERPLHCHHEKLVLIDGAHAFIGGIDLTDLGGDRFDTGVHPFRRDVGWHDAAAYVQGPLVEDAEAHFATRWHEVTGDRLVVAASQPAGGVSAQLVRTVPERIYDAVPRGDFSILEAYTGALRAARRLVYLENQFLWSSEIVQILAEKLAHPPTESFRLLVVLPARPNNGADDTRGQLGVLSEADADQRLLACTLVATSDTDAEPVYVHAKIGIVDDQWLTLGSANVNEHSLFNDTEVNIVVHDAELARDTRQRLWAEHLELPRVDVSGDATSLIDEKWRPLAEEQRRRREANAPLTHRLVAIPGVSRRSRRLLGPIQSLLVDG
jgi:phosphatidylserine/phosphatidylglycerophosphate/cardiolipin synthase-like enzyme